MSGTNHRDVFKETWKMFEATLPPVLGGIPFYIEGISSGRLERLSFLPAGATIELSQRYVIRTFAGANIKVLRAKSANDEGYIAFDHCRQFLESMDIDCMPHVSEVRWGATGE